MRLLWAIVANLLGNLLLLLPALARALRRPFYVQARLHGRLGERRAPSRWWLRRPRGASVQGIAELVERICGDRKALGLVLRLGPLQAGFATLRGLRDALAPLGQHGKRLVVHLESVGTHEYYVACGADEILMPAAGMLDLRGVFSELTFFGDPLARAGLQVEVGQAGRYKGAGERLTRASISPESREALGRLFEVAFNELVAAIAAGRELAAERVRELIDHGPYDGDAALAAGLVDAAVFADELPERLAPAGRERVALAGARRYLRARRPRWRPLRRRRQVAVLSLCGAIVSGESGTSPFGALSDGPARRALELLRRRRRVAAVIVHIDSPGGGLVPSELLWRAVRRVAEEKPVIALMGDVAASGGYYIAAGCHAIVAQPQTITGSIGVLAGKVSIAPLLRRLGIGRHAFRFGARAGLFSVGEPLDDSGRQALRELLERAYEQFLRRVAEGRARERDAIDELGQGRVWAGCDALEHGLVDALGGFAEALGLARERARRGPRERFEVVDVRLPSARGLAGMLAAGAAPAARLPALLDALAALDPSLAQLAVTALSLRDESIWALLPWLPTERSVGPTV